MGFFDSLKGAVNFVTGGGAKVSVQWNPPVAFPGDAVLVRVVATSTGGPIRSGGVFVDLAAHEQLNVPQGALGNASPPLNHSKQTFAQSFQIAPAFQLAPNETKQWEGQILLPPQAQPTYDGPFADHDWGIRGRIEVTGNDPDSGFQKIVVGKRA